MVTVREATRRDADAIRRVAERSWRAAYADVLREETIEAAIGDWYGRETTLALIGRADALYYVAEVDGEVVGYASGGPTDDDGVASLGAIYVDPDRWRAGVGSALLDRFERACAERGFDAIRIRALADNEAAAGFYRSRGYATVGKREIDLLGEAATERVFRRDLE